MSDEQITKYPDYLRDFEEIAVLAEWQRLILRDYSWHANSVINCLKLALLPEDEWENLLSKPLGNTDTDDLKLLHRRFCVTTFEVLGNYIRVWLPERSASIEYDKESFTVKLKIKRTADSDKVRKWTRNILPCNLMLDIEIVEELS